MVEKAPSRDLFKNPLHPYTRGLLEAIPVPNLSNRGKARKILAGEVVSPINPKPGCRFAGRCSLAKPECSAENIPLREVAPNHFVACCNV
jgi:oligopeptide/dipeptide ABC transporter ATP-binding protein